MGSLQPEWRPQPLGAPDTSLPGHAVPALAKKALSSSRSRDEVMVLYGGGGGGCSVGNWVLEEEEEEEGELGLRRLLSKQ